MPKNRTIAETFHPGIFIEEELEARGWTQIDLAEILGRDTRLVSEIISGKRTISPETAIGLSDAFGTSAELWMNLESSFQLSRAEKKRNDVAEKARLYAQFPVREMIKRNWIEPSTNIDVLIRRFCEFFEIPSLDVEPNFNAVTRKSTSYLEKNTISQTAWLFRARQLAQACIIENPFTQARLKACLKKLRLLMTEPENIRHIPKLMAEAGIRLIVVEPPPGSKIDGATFWIENGQSPVIVLSLRYNRIDNFWFTLPHECSHVEKEEGKDAAIVDIDLLGEEREDKPDFEKRADRDAVEFCVQKASLESFILRTDPYYLEDKIVGFSLVNQIHPGIIVGQLHHLKKIPYRNHRKFLVKIREIITETAITDGYGYTPSI